jgi:hypothetical protein
MRASPIHALVQWLRQRGRPVDYLLQASGLSQFDLTDPNSIIPILPATDFIRLIQNAEGPDIGWRIVDPEIFSQLGGLGTVLLQGPRLRDSLLKAAAVLSRHSTHSHLSVLPEKNSIIIRQFYTLELSDEFLHISQQYSVALIRSLCAMTGAHEPYFMRVEILPHPKYGLDHLKPYLGNNLQPSTSRGLLVQIPGEVADVVMPTGESKSTKSIEGWQLLRSSGEFSKSLELILRQILHEGEPSIQQVAALCGLTIRTFQRRLDSEVIVLRSYWTRSGGSVYGAACLGRVHCKRVRLCCGLQLSKCLNQGRAPLGR